MDLREHCVGLNGNSYFKIEKLCPLSTVHQSFSCPSFKNMGDNLYFVIFVDSSKIYLKRNYSDINAPKTIWKTNYLDNLLQCKGGGREGGSVCVISHLIA